MIWHESYLNWYTCIGELGEVVHWLNGRYLNQALIVCLTCLCLHTWWIYLMIIILVIVMRWEWYIYIYIWLVIPLIMMIALLVPLKWWIVFVELIRQEFRWFIWLLLLSDELILMTWLEIIYACYAMIELW